MGNDVFEDQVEEGAVEGSEGQGEQGQVTDPNTGRTMPIERFNQVYRKMKEYETNLASYGEFGKPEELKSKLEKLREWEKAVEEQRKQRDMSPSEQDELKRQQQIQRELRKAMPQLGLLDKIEMLEKRLSEYEGTATESKNEAVLEKHSAKFSELLKTSKIDTKYQPKIEDYIASQMSDDQKIKFIQGDFSVAEEIFKNELKDGLFSTMKSKNTLPTPPVRNTAGGTPPKGQEKKPMTMKEAEELGWAMMHREE